MQSLQTLSVDNLLSQIPINADTKIAIDQFILNYTVYNQNKPVVQTILDQGLYHVYFRVQDPSTIPAHINQHPTTLHNLLKSFVREQDAFNWIKEHGKDIITEQEENVDQSIVLTIIYTDNDGIYYAGEEPTELLGISSKYYPTFAFNKEGYKMLLDEHLNNIKEGSNQIVPYWIYYIGNHITHGMSLNDLTKIHKNISYGENDRMIKQQQIHDLTLFLKNPNKYILNKLNK